MLGLLKKYAFVIWLLVLFIGADIGLTAWDPVNKLPVFYKNDLAKTRLVHPEAQWEKVFFGNSTVIASYMESKSRAGFINMGINYGKITDLDAILKNHYASITKEIVIGMNFFTLMDKLPTDPYYPWHRKPYEPYVYFYRDQFKKLLTDSFQSVMTGKSVNTRFATLTEKEIYHGRLSDEKLDEKVSLYKKQYGNMTLTDFQENITALQHVIEICKERGIRLRVVWMPWNPYSTPPQYVAALKSKVNGILLENAIETIDWSDKIDTKCFHDLGHLNIEEGAPLFTKEIDPWLEK